MSENECEWCEGTLMRGNYKQTNRNHVNIYSNIPIHFFCGRDCKLKWIFKTQKELKLSVSRKKPRRKDSFIFERFRSKTQTRYA